MKIAYCSDVHIEFGSIELKNSESADVLILAGDICLANKITNYPDDILDLMHSQNGKIHRFFENCSKEFKHVIYVLGNHEHYQYEIKKSKKTLEKHLGYIKNLHILERETFIFNDVTFLGATLWTDMNNHDANTIERVSYAMNDFRIIYNSDIGYEENPDTNPLATNWDLPPKWTPLDAIVEFDKTVQWIDRVREELDIKKLVVITHHAPSFKSIHPNYIDQTLINGAYSSNLEQFIIDRPDILVWISGHIHHPQDYMIGETKILANPRGYDGREAIADNFKLAYVTI